MKKFWFLKAVTFLFGAAFFVASIAFPANGYAAGGYSVGGVANAGSITVSAAISLKNAFEEMAKVFVAQNRGARIFFNFGASGDLAMQIEQGAPVDVFASAAEKEMNEIEKKGLIEPGSRADFAGNTMVLIVPAGNPSAAQVKNFSDLARPQAARIAMGNPATVPAGRYAEAVLRYYKLLPAISGKLIYGQHVREVLAYVARKEVDAGIVYSTDAATIPDQVRVAAVAPPASHKPVLYPIAAVKGSSSPDKKLALAFISLIRSARGRAILEEFGFRAVLK
ncbi:MAG: molybdate ABC transporter substrate-binding protein [Nitrospiraceae bacterium]|nr:molybdate ABC transporter substrate-binding protein [Nitrospiraceae bacterium]